MGCETIDCPPLHRQAQRTRTGLLHALVAPVLVGLAAASE